MKTFVAFQTIYKKFFNEYKQYFVNIREYIIKQGYHIDIAERYAHLTLIRLMCIYFILKSGYLDNDKDNISNYIRDNKISKKMKRFLNRWLKILLFLITDNLPSKSKIVEIDESLNKILDIFVFFNCSLFKEKEIDKLNILISDEIIVQVIEDFFGKYNFVLDENIRENIENAINPSILGMIYESLIVGDERGKSGIFYTPPVEVDFMCRLSIYEYLKMKMEISQDNNKLSERQLINFIFNSVEKFKLTNKEQYNFVLENLQNIRIMDPACGSGSFLIGMLIVLEELFFKLDFGPTYDLKKNIICNCLYGVDIKDLALNITEFRLLLYLIGDNSCLTKKSMVKTNEKLNIKPINNEELDTFNFSTNLYCGDIIVQNNRVNYKEKIKETHESPKGNSNWRNFERIICNGFDIVIGNPPYIRHEQIIIPNIDNKQIIELSNSKMEQQQLQQIKFNYKNALLSYVKKTFNFDINRKSDFYIYFFFKGLELLKYNGVLAFLTSNSWLDVNFGSNLQEGLLKFSNIKYIIDNRVRRSFKDAEINTIITIARKKKAINILSQNFLQNYVSFISLYKPFEFLCNLKTITNMLLNNLNKDKKQNNDNYKKFDYFNGELFVKNNNNFRKVMLSEISLWKLGGGKVIDSEKSNVEIKDNYKYKGFKWSKFLIAPDIYFHIINKNRDKFEPICNNKKEKRLNLAKMTYGVKTGKNEFFHLGKPNTSNKFFNFVMDDENADLLLYLNDKKNKKYFLKYYKDDSIPLFHIEKEYWMHKLSENMNKTSIDEIKEKYQYFYIDGKENVWVPNYLIKSPKEIDSLIIIPKKLKTVLLVISENPENLQSGVLKYIEWGKSMGYNKIPSCAKRANWYMLNAKPRDEILCMMLTYDRYFFPYNKYRLYYDPTMYGIKFKIYQTYYLLILNSTLFALFTELEGRTNLGGGALQLRLYEYENMLIFKSNIINSLNKADKKKLEYFFNNPNIVKFQSIFKDFGLENNGSNISLENIDLNKVCQYRKQIDDIVLSKILNLTEYEKIELYKSTLKLIKSRLQKAKRNK
ncbi:MAG: Eco57I restriction-modification methylase domain-containing protein [Promethearchaeota archaeon]